MGYFRFSERFLDGPETHITGISDLAFYDSGSGARLYATTGLHGGVTVYDPAGGLSVIDRSYFDGTGVVGG